MIYFEFDDNGAITYQHNQPELLEREKSDLMNTGILINENDLPILKVEEGKAPTLKVNVQNKTLFYEYHEAPERPTITLSLEEKVKQLEVDKISLEDYVLGLDYRLTLKELGM